jgi:hypothetical protein
MHIKHHLPFKGKTNVQSKWLLHSVLTDKQIYKQSADNGGLIPMLLLSFPQSALLQLIHVKSEKKNQMYNDIKKLLT